VEFRAAEKVAPGEPNVHFGLGYLLWEQRQYQEAGEEFARELANDPNHAQAITYLADCDLLQGRRDDALSLLNKAIRLEPASALAHIDLATIDADAGNRDNALRELTTAEKLAPNDVNVHWRLGKLYREMGKQTQAKEEFDKAKKLVQASDETLINRMNPQTGDTQAPPSPPAGK
jgi:tetratricopeptide (TPR) repeat protein